MPILYDADEPIRPKQSPVAPIAEQDEEEDDQILGGRSTGEQFDTDQAISDAIKRGETVYTPPSEDIYTPPIDTVSTPPPGSENLGRGVWETPDGGLWTEPIKPIVYQPATDEQKRSAVEKLYEAAGYQDQYNLNADLIDDSGIDPGLVRAAEQQRQDAFQRLNEAVGYKDQYNLNADLINEGLYRQKAPTFDVVALIQSGKVTAADVAAVWGNETAQSVLQTVNALNTIDKYKVADGYNLVAAKLDGVSDEVLIAAGFDEAAVKEADIFNGRTPSYSEFMAYYGSVLGKGANTEMMRSINPLDWAKAFESKPEVKDAVYNEYIKRYGVSNWLKSTVLDAKEFTAELLIPLYWTRNAENMSLGDIALNLALDALIVVPVVKAGAKVAVKSGTKVAIKAAGVSPALQAKMNASNLLMEYAEIGKAQTSQLSKALDKIYAPVKVNGKTTTIGKLQDMAVEAKIKYMDELVRAEGVTPGKVTSKEIRAVEQQLAKFDEVNKLKSKIIEVGRTDPASAKALQAELDTLLGEIKGVSKKELTETLENLIEAETKKTRYGKKQTKLELREAAYTRAVDRFAQALKQGKMRRELRLVANQGSKVLEAERVKIARVTKGRGIFVDSKEVLETLDNMPKEAVRAAKSEVQDMFKVKRSTASEIKSLERQLAKAQKEFDTLNDFKTNPERLERGYTLADKAADLSTLKRKLTLARAGSIEALDAELKSLKQVRIALKSGVKVEGGAELPASIADDIKRIGNRVSAIKAELKTAKGEKALKLRQELLKLRKEYKGVEVRIEARIEQVRGSLAREYQTLLTEYDTRPRITKGGDVAVKTRNKPIKGGTQKTYELTKPIERGVMLADARGLVMARPIVRPSGEFIQPSKRQIQGPATDELSLVDNMIAEMGGTEPGDELLDDTVISGETETEAETSTETETETATETMTEEKPALDDAVEIERPIPKVIDRGKAKRLASPELGDDDKVAAAVNPRGSIAWYQGEIGGQPIWYVAKYPYKSEDDLIAYYGVLPPGVNPVEGGPGAALRSLQVVTGKPPEQLRVDMGIQDITFKGRSMSYSQDKEQRTRGDITVRKGRIKTVRRVKPLDKFV